VLPQGDGRCQHAGSGCRAGQHARDAQQPIRLLTAVCPLKRVEVRQLQRQQRGRDDPVRRVLRRRVIAGERAFAEQQRVHIRNEVQRRVEAILRQVGQVEADEHDRRGGLNTVWV
jgi:hypothetical protein